MFPGGSAAQPCRHQNQAMGSGARTARGLARLARHARLTNAAWHHPPLWCFHASTRPPHRGLSRPTPTIIWRRLAAVGGDDREKASKRAPRSSIDASGVKGGGVLDGGGGVAARSFSSRVASPAPAERGGPSVDFWGPATADGEKITEGRVARESTRGLANGAASRPPAAPPTTDASGEALAGEVRRITFHNPDNQWTVARLQVSKSHVDALPLGAMAASGGKHNRYAKKTAKKGAGKKEKVVTVVGHIPGVAEGQFLKMTGNWRDVERWGMQFVLNATPEEVEPEDEDAILRYLAGGVLPGVGKATAAKLVTHFGTNTFHVFDSPDAVERLLACPGIGAKTAEKLKGAWDATRGRRDAVVFLERHGVSPALAQRAAAMHGARTEERVRADPFGSFAGLRGATFHRCDVLAARLNKAPDDRARVAAAMLHVLQTAAHREGHVYLPWGQLCEGVGRLLGHKQATTLTRDALEEAADELLRRGAIVRAANGGGVGGEREETPWSSSGVFASVLDAAEAAVAADVAKRLRQPRREPDVARVRRWLQAAADKEGWRLLSPAQEAFLDLALREPISVLTGGPGTGKTFATHIAVRLWRAMGRKVLMCAPTGRAAQRLAEIATAGRRMSVPVQSSTIHRLLEARGLSGKEDEEDDDESAEAFSYRGKFLRDARSPLDADVVVVDESSMLDLPLCAALLDAVKPDAQLVFVGDADQLPSVGPGSVLRDIISSGAVPAVHLRDVFRQAQTSGIVRAAHAVNAGVLPEVPMGRWDPAIGTLVVDPPSVADASSAADGRSPGVGLPATAPPGTPSVVLPGGAEVHFSAETWEGANCVLVTLPDDSPAGYEGALEALFSGALPALQGLNPATDLQVLTPFRRGAASTAQLNAFLQARLNPPAAGRLETRVGDVTLREGDRVLQIRNDYTKEVFNGDLGTVVAVDGDGSVRVVFGAGAGIDGRGDEADEDGAGDTIARALASLKTSGREVSYSRTELRDLIPAWAITVHKAQGSEYRAVVLCLAANHRPLLRRELVYTAVSRAKEVLVILAARGTLDTAVVTVGTDRRNTMLANRLAPMAPGAPSCPSGAAIAAAAELAGKNPR